MKNNIYELFLLYHIVYTVMVATIPQLTPSTLIQCDQEGGVDLPLKRSIVVFFSLLEKEV